MSRARSLGRFSLSFVIAAVALPGCATAFSGDSHVPGGANGCRTICGGYGMELAGMVAMGQYSDGCICKVHGQTAGTDGTELAVAGAGSAAVGVIMETRRRDEQARRATLIP